MQGNLKSVLLAFAMAALILFDTQTTLLQPMRYTVDSALIPVRALVSLLDDSVRRVGSNLRSKRSQAREITELNRELLLLRWQLLRAREIIRENERLRALWVVTEGLGENEVIGASLAAPPDALNPGILQIDRGSRHGVLEGHAVLDSWGLIGRVASLTWQDSEVLTVSDPAHSVLAEVARTGERILLHGGGVDRLEAALVPPDSDLQVGDELVTSGLADYRAGLRIGTITRVRTAPEGDYLQVEAKMSARADLSRHFILIQKHTSHRTAGAAR
ncbi:MAG: rod shape-determining protein MreC [Gammaproteobacteria bacterium AqS3]|nr:rod shape-determining protein MreC [Gammaproteobacteria bacterium AqS3]